MKAVVLLSGGLDSTTALAMSLDAGIECFALTVNYGQRHAVELVAARRVAERYGCAWRVVDVPIVADIAKSALTDRSIEVPVDTGLPAGIPATYVPGRNTIMLALALALAESLDVRDLVAGFNVIDASGYPDCRRAFVDAFTALADVATRPGNPWRIHVPLIAMTKAEIIRAGLSLGVDYALTHTCYAPKGGAACRRCDACALRLRGFAEAGAVDPAWYA